MGEFKDHPSKQVIRMAWCKPLIQFVHETLGYKLIYLGLPGPQALDLLEWIDCIEQVIAFQCRDYPNPSSIDQPHDKIEELETKLREFERKGKLATFALYDGYIEEVVLRGRDTNGNHFGQTDVVTIYNLDFCNGITMPLKIPDDLGNVYSYYKSDAIKRLLEIQRDVTSQVRSKKFIMFLTIHSSFWDQEARNFISQTDSQPLRLYFQQIKSLDRHEKNIRLLKSYIYNTIIIYFRYCDFTPEFLPAVYYKGSGKNNWLLHFTIIGALNKGISVAPCYQRTEDFLNQKLLTVKDENIVLRTDRSISESDCSPNSVDTFSKSECYNKLWV